MDPQDEERHVTGVPQGEPDPPDSPSGGHGRGRHWKQAQITNPGLDDRGSVFFAALQMTRMPMVLTDPRQPDNPIVFANRAFSDLTGYEEKEIVGRNCRFLQGPESDREAVAELAAAIAAEDAVSLELINYRRDGSSFWNAIFIAPVYDDHGQLIYFFASQLDVTRRRESEQAFRQAQKMEAIGQLTAGLAHDFNNLLQVVGGSLEMVLNSDLTERQRRQVENAARATERGAKLTRQLLAFARKTRLEPRRADLNDLINETDELLDNAVGPRIELRTELRRRLPMVNIDSAHFEMALLNLLINARDAMPEGGTVTIATGVEHLNGDAPKRQLKPGDYAWVEVRDQGIGMAPEVVRRATEPFFSTKGKDKGTGLGLAMAHGFVQQSMGRLEIDSAVGNGTRIRMLFPVLDADRPTLPRAKPPMAAALGAAQRILVVEDSEDVRNLAGDLLEELGYQVIMAESGESALRILEQDDAIDLVFSDIVMPGGISGLELVDTLRAIKSDVPVLLATGYNDDLVADIPRGLGLDVLSKPYRRNELADRVAAALKRSGDERGVAPSRFGVAEA